MRLNWLLIFIPAALALSWHGANSIVIFAASALAIVPLAALMGEATDALAEFVGPAWGGLLSASLGNAPEIIIGVFALRQGLVSVVKSSIVGSILGNLLFGLGMAMIAGGIRNGTQQFDMLVSNMNAGLLMLAASGLIIPAVFYHTSARVTHAISLEIAAVLCLVYMGSLLFTLLTSRPALGKEKVEAEVPGATEPPGAEPRWGKGKAIAILAVVAVALAVMSEILTDAVEPASRHLGLTPVFAGVFLLALVGNVAELFNAVRFARMDKMDLTLGVTVGASLQVALFVAPVLVFVAVLMRQPMDLVFTRFEIVAVVLSVVLARQLIGNGKSNWLEGLMLVGVYVMLGIGFFYLPLDPPPLP
ncbi:Putative cation exchanger YfkE [Aquisphaera giovannonii]|uniref:Ca(2+)/H(+) antiporter n=1 Tax=Aquisphaera giovannonii TaxID=406548 RepID=A0A5B9W3I2_9BACT|nr:calcium/proton exchanger [Aquisphaera giovannonii]QEH34794.1 Putative cation exchanger YfkE [Aquisphaera giovannonii]